jgi:hypothetical protein
MKTGMTTSRQTQWIAGTVAALATLLTMGGSLTLAEHYAQTGASRDASGYYAAQQARRIGCSDNGNSRTAVVSLRGGGQMLWRGAAA